MDDVDRYYRLAKACHAVAKLRLAYNEPEAAVIALRWAAMCRRKMIEAAGPDTCEP